MKYNYFMMLSLFMSMMACAPTDDTISQENIILIENYLEAVSKNDLKLMESLLADHYIGLGPSVGDTVNKQQALANWKLNSENLYESIVFEFSKMLPTTIKEGPARGKWVSNWSHATISYKDGRGPVNLWVNSVYKIEGGKIAKSRTFYNEADVLAQLGYRIFPPSTKLEKD